MKASQQPGRGLRPLALVSLALTACLPAPPPPAEQGSPPARAEMEHPAVNAGRAIAAVEDYSPQPPILPLSPEEQLKHLYLPPGYRLEPVLTEPHIREPAQIAFDGNGRMFVLELRSYMQDADATGELWPTSRISWHGDSDGDGVYDRHGVFVDSLVFPRFVMPFGENSILTAESNHDDVFRYTDTDGDGRADRRERFTGTFGRSANVEHQPANLRWAMDNWLYSTYNAFRMRWTPGGVLREPTSSPGGAWGVTQDDFGKVWVQGGASGHPGHFQFPLHYGNFSDSLRFEPGFAEPFGVAGLGDYQPGPTASRPNGTLAVVTGSAGNDIVRGHRMPADLRGDYLYGEPVARIVRRVRPEVREGMTRLRNVYQAERSEFIRSTDPLFRPIQMETAPDGTVYIVDIYRGIIQEGNWTQAGTHLRRKIDQYGLGKIVGRGRIWRLTYDGLERDRTMPRMYGESAAELVRHLEHPNGWWRDMAQQTLVMRQDRSVAPTLTAMARTSQSRFARFHALWTLEGLGTLDAALVRELMRDRDPQVRIQAIRASETLYKAGDRSLADDYRAMSADPDTDVVIQAMLTLNVLRVPDAAAAIRAATAARPARGVQLIGAQLLRPRPSFAGSGPQAALLQRGEAVYREVCSECHGETGLGTPFLEGQTIAPALAGNPRMQAHRDYLVRTLLHGLTGPIDGRSYPGGIMVPMGQNSDEWVAAVASYVRTQLTNNASPVTPEQVAATRAATASRREPWLYDELVAGIPRRLEPTGAWKATASHNAQTRVGGTADPSAAFTFEGWTTGISQAPGMWFRVDLPQPVALAEIQFNSPTLGGGSGPEARPARSTAPRGYRVELSVDGEQWKQVATGESSAAETVISFPPTRARSVRITQTAAAPEVATPWTMLRLQLFEQPGR